MKRMEKSFVVAIDGPAGAGKSTIAKNIAAQLGFAYVDTGAMYRAVTLKWLQGGEPFCEKILSDIARQMKIIFLPENGKNKVFIDGTEVTEEIRSAEVTANVSRVAAIAGVREAMVSQQRRMGSEGQVVLDGRDIGTVVFPDAQLKIFLTASVEERARRRYNELLEKGECVALARLQKEIAERDRADMERTISPLRKAEDAVYVDSSKMTIEQTTKCLLDLVKGRI